MNIPEAVPVVAIVAVGSLVLILADLVIRGILGWRGLEKFGRTMSDIGVFLRVAILSFLLAGRNGPRAMPDGLRRVLLWGLVSVGRQWRAEAGGLERWKTLRVQDGWLDVAGDLNLHGLLLERLPVRIRMVAGVLNLGNNRLNDLSNLAGPVRALIVDSNPIQVLDGSVVVESIDAWECHQLREIRNMDGVSVTGLRNLDIARNHAAHERKILTGVADANKPGQRPGPRLM